MISLLFPPFGYLVEYWSVLVDILVDLCMGLTLQLSTKPILAGFKHLTSTYSHSCASVLVPSPGIQNCYSQTKVIFPFFMRLGTCKMQTKLVCVCVCVCVCVHVCTHACVWRRMRCWYTEGSRIGDRTSLYCYASFLGPSLPSCVTIHSCILWEPSKWP